MNLRRNVHSLETKACWGRGWGGPPGGNPPGPFNSMAPEDSWSLGNQASGAITPRACVTPDPGGEFCFPNRALKLAIESLDWIVFSSLLLPPPVFGFRTQTFESKGK